MMKVSLTLLTVVAALVMSAVTSVAAYAEPTKECEPEVFTVCVEAHSGEALLAVEESASLTASKASETTAKLTASGLASIQCEKAGATGTFSAPEKPVGTAVSKLVITFESCRDTTSEETCSVTEPVKTKELKGTLSFTEEEATDVTLAPASGTEVASVTLANKSGHTCATKGTYKVTGEQVCSLTEYELAAVKHNLVCQAKGSKLKFGEKAAELELTEEVALGGGLKEDPWTLLKSPPYLFALPTGTAYPQNIEGVIKTGTEFEFLAGGVLRALCTVFPLSAMSVAGPSEIYPSKPANPTCAGGNTVTVSTGCVFNFYDARLNRSVLAWTYELSLRTCEMEVTQGACKIKLVPQGQPTGVEALNATLGLEIYLNLTQMTYNENGCGGLNGRDGAIKGYFEEKKMGGGTGLQL